MIKFDTLKIVFPTSYLTDIETEKLNISKDKENKTVYQKKYIAAGLVDIRIGNRETAIEFSAKILKEDYPKLLTINTIKQALENIKAVAPIAFNTNEILELAHVVKAHAAEHLKLSKSLENYITPVVQLYINRSYLLRTYNTAVTFTQQKKTSKNNEYFKIYGKAEELKTSKNNDYKETLTKEQKQAVIQYFSDVVKIEVELIGKKKLRQYITDIHPNVQLKDLLMTKCNPIAEQFKEITKYMYEALEKEEVTKSLDFSDNLNLNEEQLFNTLRLNNFDLNKIDFWLKRKAKSKSTLQRYRKECTQLLAAYNNYTSTDTGKELLLELKDKICNPIDEVIPETENDKIQELPITIETSVSKMNQSTENVDVSNLINFERRLVEYKSKITLDDAFWEQIVSSPLKCASQK